MKAIIDSFNELRRTSEMCVCVNVCVNLDMLERAPSHLTAPRSNSKERTIAVSSSCSVIMNTLQGK